MIRQLVCGLSETHIDIELEELHGEVMPDIAPVVTVTVVAQTVEGHSIDKEPNLLGGSRLRRTVRGWSSDGWRRTEWEAN